MVSQKEECFFLHTEAWLKICWTLHIWSKKKRDGMRIYELWAQVSSIQPPTCSYKANTLINVDFPPLDPTIFHLAWLGFIWFCAALHGEGRRWSENGCDFAPAVHGWVWRLNCRSKCKEFTCKKPPSASRSSLSVFSRGFWPLWSTFLAFRANESDSRHFKCTTFS